MYWLHLQHSLLVYSVVPAFPKEGILVITHINQIENVLCDTASHSDPNLYPDDKIKSKINSIAMLLELI